MCGPRVSSTGPLSVETAIVRVSSAIAPLYHSRTHAPSPCFSLLRSSTILVGRPYEEMPRGNRGRHGGYLAALLSRHLAPEAKDLEAKDLVKLLRGFDHTRLAGFFCFIIPLIVDTVFHRATPKVFQPNTIAFLQRKETPP